MLNTKILKEIIEILCIINSNNNVMIKSLIEVNESLNRLRVSNDLIIHQLKCLSEDNITIIDNLINIRWEIKTIRERIT